MIVLIYGCDDDQWVDLGSLTNEERGVLQRLAALVAVKAGGCVPGIILENSEGFYMSDFDIPTTWADVVEAREMEKA